jgi:hypothetical protein
MPDNRQSIIRIVKMNQAINWTLEEFELLLDGSSLSDEELSEKLERRSSSAVRDVRQGIHSFHNGQDVSSTLSQMMVKHLKQRRGSLTCPVCGIRI